MKLNNQDTSVDEEHIVYPLYKYGVHWRIFEHQNEKLS